MTFLSALTSKGTAQSRPIALGRVSSSGLMTGATPSLGLASGQATLSGLWSDGEAVHMALIDEPSKEILVLSLPCPERRFPSVGVAHPPALRLERMIRDLYGLVAGRLPGSASLARSRPLGRRASARRTKEGSVRWRALSIPPGGGTAAASDPGRPGACRHHRAWSLPLHGQWRNDRPARRTPGLCA